MIDQLLPMRLQFAMAYLCHFYGPDWPSDPHKKARETEFAAHECLTRFFNRENGIDDSPDEPQTPPIINVDLSAVGKIMQTYKDEIEVFRRCGFEADIVSGVVTRGRQRFRARG